MRKSKVGTVFAGLVDIGTSDKPTAETLATAGNENLAVSFKMDKSRRLNRLQHGVTRSAELIKTETGRLNDRYRAAMITLTYAKVDDWHPRHITDTIKAYREWCRRKKTKFRYVWVAELQGRGAVHYHIVLWLPRRLKPPFPDKQGWWKHGSTNSIWARKPVGYVIKYATKMKSKDGKNTVAHYMPEGLRLWAAGGLTLVDKLRVSWYLGPGWIKAISAEKDGCRRTPNGRWWHPGGQWLIRSPWRFEGMTINPDDNREYVHLFHVGWPAPEDWLRDPGPSMWRRMGYKDIPKWVPAPRPSSWQKQPAPSCP